MDTGYRPWGKIFTILLISAGIFSIFVWKYLDTMRDYAADDGRIYHVPAILQPFYDVLGEKMFLVFGAVAALLFAGVSLKAIAGRPKLDD